jgi:hypothetical protein
MPNLKLTQSSLSVNLSSNGELNTSRLKRMKSGLSTTSSASVIDREDAASVIAVSDNDGEGPNKDLLKELSTCYGFLICYYCAHGSLQMNKRLASDP